MGEVWIKEARRLTPAGNHNAMSGVGGPRATLHCTVSPSGVKTDGGTWFDAMHRVLTSKKAESHLLWDPVTDELGQYFPLDRAARALAGSAGALSYSHNRVGSVNIQIEVVANPRDWTATWKPGPNFRAMLRAIRSWGIRDEFIFRVATSGTDRANVVRPNRLLTSVEGGGRWWGHCHYGDGESHWDPGPINLARFFAAAPTTNPPQEDDMAELNEENARQLLTRFTIFKDPITGKDVAPSNVIETAARESVAASRKVDGLKTDVGNLRTQLDGIATRLADGGLGGVSDEQLERVLRKVLGGLDGATPTTPEG